MMQPTVLLPGAGVRSPPPGGRDLLRVGGAVLGLALLAGAVLLARRPQSRPEPGAVPATAAAPSRRAAAAPTLGAPAAVAVVTDPAEAAPSGPLGKVSVVSSYPIEVFWKGKLVGKGTSPQLSLPAGRQVLTLVATPYFLRSNVAVNVRPQGGAGVEAPRLGKINIKASPDNCEVFIDGSFVDYPPILDRAVATGGHTVSFKWPDGTRREEQAQVDAGSPVYVIGRKD